MVGETSSSGDDRARGRVDPLDRAEAVEQLARYAELIDAGDFSGVGELLAHATIEDGDGRPIASGAEQIAELYRATTRRHGDGTPLTAHLVTNAIVDAVEGGLEMRSRFLVLQATDLLALQPVVAGTYTDRMERIEGRWRFVRRRMDPRLWGDVSEHLSFDPT